MQPSAKNRRDPPETRCSYSPARQRSFLDVNSGGLNSVGDHNPLLERRDIGGGGGESWLFHLFWWLG
jgi:hypothetical protein